MSREQWQIEKIVPGGAGMARVEGGLIGFAEGALPGETIEVEEREVRKGHVVARRLRVLKPAPERVEPPCPHASERCGCDWLHASADAQRRYKLEIVRDALTRIGKFRVLPEIAMHAAPETLGYRSRVRVHVDTGGRVGYHERGSHRLIEIESCKVARPELDQALARFRAAAAEHPRAAAEFAEAELRVAPSDPKPLAELVPRAASALNSNAFVRALGAEFHVVIGDAASDYVQRFPLADGAFVLAPPRAFVQVNWEVNRLLVSALVRHALLRGCATFLDLYSGAGNFAIGLLAAGLSGLAVENDPHAVRAAERAFAEQGFTRGRVLREDAARALGRRNALPRADLVVLDPPRAGARELLPDLVRLRPPSIAYCSCDPVTLARDLKVLTDAGYALESLQAFDMFPGTHHVETLAWLGQ
jgi:23S rRNA (uracil1939-C5)-methyltransferase